MATGRYRIKRGWGDKYSVLVRYDEGNELEIPASIYVANGYDPPLDWLPEYVPKIGGTDVDSAKRTKVSLVSCDELAPEPGYSKT